MSILPWQLLRCLDYSLRQPYQTGRQQKHLEYKLVSSNRTRNNHPHTGMYLVLHKHHRLDMFVRRQAFGNRYLASLMDKYMYLVMYNYHHFRTFGHMSVLCNSDQTTR